MVHVVSLQFAQAARLPMVDRPSVRIETGHGITGDRYENARHRHVTIQSLEEIGLAEAELGRPLQAALTRRNITIGHGALDRTPGHRVRLGDPARGWVLLEVVRDAAPCKLLEDELGRDAKLALHKRAGVVYRTIEGGDVHVGDRLEAVLEDEAS